MSDREFNFEPQSPWERIIPKRYWPYVPGCGSHPKDHEWWARFHEETND